MMTTLNNIYDICSYCLSESNLINIFENFNGKYDNNVIHLTSKCLNIEINVNDEYPRFICNNCLEALNSYYSFQKRSLWSLNYLKELATKLKQEKKYEVIEEEISTSKHITLRSCMLKTNIVTDTGTYDINNKESTSCPYCDEYFENLNMHICRDHFDVNFGEDNTMGYFITNVKESYQSIVGSNSADLLDNKDFVKIIQTDSDQSIQHIDSGTLLIADSIGKQKLLVKDENQKVKIKKKQKKNNTMKVCHICGKNVKYMDSHIKMHVPDSYTCDLCHKTLTTREGIRQHMKVHLNKREYKCPICPMDFNTRKPLEIHLISHTGEKNFECETCGKRYTQQSSLRTHIKTTHARVYNVQCRYCDKLFYHKSLKRTHENLHTGRKYQCKFCPKVLKSQVGYFQHMNRHSAVNPYECEKCDEKFTRLKEYKIHCRQHLLNII